MLRKVFLVAVILSFLVLAANPRPANEVKAMAPEPPGTSLSYQAPAATNLLANGNMDQVKFYWRPTNHFVAGMWYEWFWTGAIPEFIDGGIKTHNQCYPEPPPGKICVDDMHNSSQGYIRWGGPYIAGIYQPVSAVPCALYQLEAYNRNDDVNYHPKVGIDPTGQVLPPYIPPDGDDTPVNCPPDGKSKCPNPGIESLSELPPHMVWSAEISPPKFTWVPISVTAEALSTTISVWTYAAPENTGSPSRSTFWDYASLVQVIPATLSPDGRIPAPDGKISGLTVTPLATTAQIQWTTSQPAFSQVFYRLRPPAPSCTGSACFFAYTVYLPLIARGPGSVNDFTYKTVPTNVPTPHPSVSLTGLEAGKGYDFVVMSRAFTNGACVSSASSTGTFTTTTP